jgi:hypothetical protein
MLNQWTAFDDLFYDPEPSVLDLIESGDLPGHLDRVGRIHLRSVRQRSRCSCLRVRIAAAWRS